MQDILYDCYDENEQPIGIIFAKNSTDLLRKNPKVKYVRGIDHVVRLPNWFEVRQDGLWPCQPKMEAHRKESDWHYADFV